MDERAIQEWRAQRLAAMVEREGGKAPAGRRLGYRDGAFVGQMLRGERPITEKTVLAVHSLPGYSGWFSNTLPESAPPPYDPAPTLAQALEAVVNAISALPQPARKALAEDLALLAVAPGDAETRQRVANALQTGPSMAQRLLAIPSQVESPRLPQRATEK